MGVIVLSGGCEIATHDSAGITGSVDYSIAGLLRHYEALDREPRGLRVACERYGRSGLGVDTVHVGFADPAAPDGRVEGFDLFVGIDVKADPAAPLTTTLVAWDGSGTYVGDGCRTTLDGYDAPGGKITISINCPASHLTGGSPGPPLGLIGDLAGCSL